MNAHSRWHWTLNLPWLALAVLLGYAAWARGGTRPELLPLAAVLAVVAVALAVLLPPRYHGEPYSAARERMLRNTLRDPLFYLGLALLILLGLQVLNSGRAPVFDAAAGKWNYGPPPWPGWPSSVCRAEALQMLYWFGGAWLVVWDVRHGLDRKDRVRLLWALAVNGALLALFGIAQYASGTQRIFFTTPLNCYFFASFGYPNHAGAYFTLLLAVSGGLLLRAIRREEWTTIGVAGALALLNLVGATLSFSRAAILLAWGLAGFGACYGILRAWREQSLTTRLNEVLLTAGAVAALVALYDLTPTNPVRRELSTISARGFQSLSPASRWVQIKVASHMWADAPLFGVGGWGYRYLLGIYLPPERWNEITTGKANVHNDPLQFLAEFGAVGAGLLLAIWLVLLAPALRLLQCVEGLWHAPPLPVLLLAGTFLTLIHSMIDLPFRSPAILWLWLVCLACVPSLLDRTRIYSPD